MKPELFFYNTASRAKERFTASGDTLGMYTCGPTVYNYAHIGNLRSYIFADVLRRTLEYFDYEVPQVMNVTDVGHLTSDADSGEDKMEVGARRAGKSAWELAAFFLKAFEADLDRLHILPPDIWCKATDHIAEQIDLIRKLEANGFTYVIPGEGVYFDTSKMPDYGKMARLDISGLRAGARVEMLEGKRSATDFALWKFSPPDKKRQMEWPSPWGVGFPGWHIECSAMAIKYLGERLDIHAGGIDHVPVHHTNEIAQAECALGHPWVNWWVHGEFLVMPKEDGGEEAKMSKSSGDFLTLDRLIEKGYDPVVYRLFCLGAHYRQQLAFSWAALDAAKSALESLRRGALALRAAAADLPPGVGPSTGLSPGAKGQTGSGLRVPGSGSPILEEHYDLFREACEDDLNMPRALAATWGMLRDGSADKGRAYATLLKMDDVLGLGVATMEAPEASVGQEQQRRIAALIDERTAAKKARNFARADEIRKQLAAEGILLEDTPKGTIWRSS